MDASPGRDLGVLVIRAIAESDGNRPIVVEVLEVGASGSDRVLLVTSSAGRATRAVRDWLDAHDRAMSARGADGRNVLAPESSVRIS